MKSRKSISITALFFAAVLILGGCKAGEKEEMLSIVPLNEQQLSQVNAAFELMLPVEGEMELNPLCCFLTSYYDSVTQLDMSFFLRNFPGSEPGTPQEFEALRSVAGWPFADLEHLSDMPVPLHRYPAEKVRAALEKYAAIGFEDLEGGFGQGVYYLEQYDAFYNYTSDFGLEPLRCTHGEIQGDTLRLYSNAWDGSERVLTLEKRGDSYVITAHQLLDNPQ